MNGGRTADGGSMFGESVFYSDQDNVENAMSLADEMTKAQSVHSPEIERLQKQLLSTRRYPYEEDLSSFMWICSGAANHGVVMVRNII